MESVRLALDCKIDLPAEFPQHTLEALIYQKAKEELSTNKAVISVWYKSKVFTRCLHFGFVLEAPTQGE